MAAPHDGILAVVIGDDAVAAGMLALDLVQAGFDAHGAGDVWAAAQRLQSADGAIAPPVLIAIYHDFKRTLEVWRHLQDERVRVRMAVVVHERDLVAAEAAAVAGGWLGVIRAPVRTEALTDLLDRHGQGEGVANGVETGELASVNVTTVLERELLVARRDPAHRNSVLRVESHGLTGEVALVDGELVHAQVEEDRGRHALERMACWQDGGWTLKLGRFSGEPTLTGGWRGTMAVAMEYARRVEEARRNMPLRNDVCTVRWERVRPLPVVAEALFRRIASGMLLNEALDGRGDDELEAYAALLTRIRRGGVEPLEKTLLESPTQFPTHTHRRPGIRTSNPPGTNAEYPSQAPHIRTSDSHRRSHRQRHSASYTQAVPTSGPAGLVTALQDSAETHDRHPATATYRAMPLGSLSGGFPNRIPGRTPSRLPSDLPEIPVQSVREHTPLHTQVLPPDLPDVESDGWEAAPAEAASTEPIFAATGWFGLNVGKPADADFGARVDAMRDSLVQGGEAAVAAQLDVQMSQSVAELPRVALESDSYETDDAETHYSLFATDAEIDEAYENERSQLEILAPPGRAGRSARVFWLVALVAIASTLTLLIWPGSPITEGSATRPPAMRSYQRAVDLITANKPIQAQALLRLVHGSSAVPPEATLQLAVLEVQSRQFSAAQRHLQAYLRLPDAQHVPAATRLYTHVFGALP